MLNYLVFVRNKLNFGSMSDWALKRIGVETVGEPLTPGDRVELGFTVDGDIVREHLWVCVFATLWHGKAYLGVLDSDAATIDGLKSSQQVTFLPKHVIKYKKASFFRGGFA